jgi:hypothetical protein
LLGISFNTEELEWFLPARIADILYRKDIESFKSEHNSCYMNLNTTQKLMGQINELNKVSPSVEFFKDAGNRLMRDFSGNKFSVNGWGQTSGFAQSLLPQLGEVYL